MIHRRHSPNLNKCGNHHSTEKHQVFRQWGGAGLLCHLQQLIFFPVHLCHQTCLILGVLIQVASLGLHKCRSYRSPPTCHRNASSRGNVLLMRTHTHMPKNKQSRNLVSSIHQLTDRHTFRAEVHDLHREECSVSCNYTSLYSAFLIRRILQEGLLHVCSTLDAHRWAVPVPHNAATRQGHVELLAAKLLLLHFLRPRQNAHRQTQDWVFEVPTQVSKT